MSTTPTGVVTAMMMHHTSPKQSPVAEPQPVEPMQESTQEPVQESKQIIQSAQEPIETIECHLCDKKTNKKTYKETLRETYKERDADNYKEFKSFSMSYYRNSSYTHYFCSNECVAIYNNTKKCIYCGYAGDLTVVEGITVCTSGGYWDPTCYDAYFLKKDFDRDKKEAITKDLTVANWYESIN